MKRILSKAKTHSKKVVIHLKRHHKKYLFGVLCCEILALIGILTTLTISNIFANEETPIVLTSENLDQLCNMDDVWDWFNVSCIWKEIESIEDWAFSQYSNKIKSIDLSKNKISFINKWVFNELSLDKLDLSYNNLSKIDYSAFEWIVWIKILNLSFNQIFQLELKEIINLSMLNIESNCLPENEIYMLKSILENDEYLIWFEDQKTCFHISYNPNTLTNQEVTATITITWNADIVHDFGDYHDELVFKDTWTEFFDVSTFVNKSWNIINYPENDKFPATVTWIDIIAPTCNVTYSTTSRTTWTVFAYLTGCNENVTVTNNSNFEHTFEDTWTFTFEFQDLAGNTWEATATVDRIDRENPTCSVTYSIMWLTNQNVTATLTWCNEDVTVTNNSGFEYIFENTWSFTFEFQDLAGNTGDSTATVTWIDKTKPTCDTIEYSTTWLTNQNVTATLTWCSEEITVTNNSWVEHMFQNSGSFTFEFRDLAGNTWEAIATVTWIDKTAPTCNVTYSTTWATTWNVTATVTGCSETITWTNLQHTFTGNWTYTFRFQDLAGNTWELEAYVDWIDVTWIVLNDKNVKSICKATQNQANRILNCSGKAIVDIKPGTFNSLDDITSIILSSNRLSIIKSWVFDWLNNLKYIDFTSNNISGIEIQSFKNLDNLDSIWFNDNLISSFNSDIIMSCDNLHYISLYNNKIKSIDNGTFGWLNNLTSIHLSNNEIDSVASNTFNWLSNLVYINLGWNKLKAINPNLFNWLLKLEWIYLDNNELTGLDVWTFSGLNNLIHLYLNSNKIESVSSGVFDWLSSLKFLHLEENNIKDIEIWSFKSLSSLQDLSLHSNSIQYLKSWMFIWLSKLSNFTLYNNKITDIELWALNPLENLWTLNLGQNQITNINRRNFNWLDKLSYLLLNNNCLSQNINDILPRINLIRTSNQKLCFSPIYEYYWDHAIAKLDLTWNANLYNRYHDYFNLNKTIEFTSTWTEYFDVSERSWNSIFINAWSWIIYYPVDWKVAATVNSFNWYNSVDAWITFSISVDDNISSWKYIEFTVKVVKNWLTYKDYTDKIMIVLTDKRWNLIDDNLYDVYNNWIYEFTQSDRWRKTFKNWLKIKKEWTYKLKVFDLNNHEWSEIIVVWWSHNAANFEYDTLKFNPNYSDEMNKAYQFSRYFKITTKNSIKDANMYGWLNRVAMAKMLTNYAENVLGIDDFDTSRNCTFKDVSVALDKEYNNWVTKACQLGIMWVNAKDNNFNPYWTVTRAQFATALSRLLYWTKDWTDNYYSTHISKLYREWIITKTDPTLKELRWYVMLMLMRAWK